MIIMLFSLIRLYGRRRRISSMQKMNSDENNHHCGNQQSTTHETNSMTELCSLNSSAVISTKSEPKLGNVTRRKQQQQNSKGQLAQLARRDYRFQGFKEVNNGGAANGDSNINTEHYSSMTISTPPPSSSSHFHEISKKTSDNRNTSIPVSVPEIKVLSSLPANNNNKTINKAASNTTCAVENELQHNPLFVS